MELVTSTLLGEGKIDYLFDTAHDINSLNSLLNEMVNRLLRGRLQKTLASNIILQKLSDSTLFKKWTSLWLEWNSTYEVAPMMQNQREISESFDKEESDNSSVQEQTNQSTIEVKNEDTKEITETVKKDVSPNAIGRRC